MRSFREKSELNHFWEEQNNKLLAYDSFLKERGDILSQRLYFKYKNNKTTELDFSIFDLPHLSIEYAATLTLNGIIYPLSMKQYAKLSVLCSLTHSGYDNIYATYRIITHLSYFLNTQDCNSLTPNNIENFHLSFLTQRVKHEGVFPLLAPASYQSSYGNCNFVNNRNQLQSLGVVGLVDMGLTKKKLEVTLDSACQAVMGITLQEYKRGGSYNFLTLELGQYYVDFLRITHESDYLYTLVCCRAISTVSQLFKLESRKENSNSHVVKVFADTIRGTFQQFNGKYGTNYLSRNIVNCELENALFVEYQTHFEKVKSLHIENICDVCNDLGLEMRFDSVEVIRILMLQKHYPFEAHKTPSSVWSVYLTSLNKTHVGFDRLSKITVDDVYTLMSRTIKKQRLDKVAFLASLQKWSNELIDTDRSVTYRKMIGEFERISDSMTSLMVAWLGYRKSEFGFPLNAIHVEQNLDILDNSHVPFRFKLKWIVPKTNGKTKVNREITSQCYQIAAQLNQLFQPSIEDPCLYKTTGSQKKKQASNCSAQYIETRIKSNWVRFITHYPPFIEVNELERLSQREASSLSQNEQKRFSSLIEIYDLTSARSQHLLDTSKVVRQDYKKLACTAFEGNIQPKFKKSLIEFHNTGDISNTEHKTIVDKYLSDETKAWLLSDKINLDVKSMADISSELIKDVYYPTPHAFRHIWAEAVLTRYQGDVGAAIRHQFCHMDESFFMAYLRDKEAKDLLKVARMKVLNSIVDNLILDNKHIGRKYLGGFARFVGKAASVTKAVTQSEMLALREQIAGRVISISSSHFSYCIPREGAESRAKCAEFGEINPHNAKPSFCLDCTNALITEGHLRGIWEVTQPFVKESLNENVMGFMIERHLPTLRSAHKRIQELRNEKNAHQVDKILMFILKAIKSIETKLSNENAPWMMKN